MNKYESNVSGGSVYESECIVGERGQITIPKIIREKEGLRARDRVIVKIDAGKIVVEKGVCREEKEALLKEYYKKHARENEALSEDMVTAGADGGLLE